MIFICLPVQTWELNQPASQPALEPDNTGRPALWRPGPQLSPSSLHFSTSEFQLKLSGQVVYIFQPKIVNFLPHTDTTHWKTIWPVLPVASTPLTERRLYFSFSSLTVILQLISGSFPKTELVHPSPH